MAVLGKRVLRLQVLLLLFVRCVLTATYVQSPKECEVPCTHDKTNTTKACVSYTCFKQGVMTTCTLNSLHTLNTESMRKVECLAPEHVHGLPEFCMNILGKTSEPALDNIVIRKTTPAVEEISVDTIKDVPNVKEECLSVTILASVATGSFLVGCFLMWLLLVLLRFFRPCGSENRKSKNNNTRSNSDEAIYNDGTGSRHRITSNVSIDSGLSSTQVTSPQHNTAETRHATRPDTSKDRLFLYDTTMAPTRTINNINYSTNQTMDFYGVYAPISEGSNRDYQSILGSSVYAPSSEGGNSDYSCPPTHRVLLVRENGEIYQASSESSGNDYSSLKGARCLVGGGGVYYATSDSSYKDYTSLFDEHEQDLAAGYCDVEDMLVDGATNANTKFKVNGFVIPKAKLSLIGKPAPCLGDVNEYEVVHEKCDPNVPDVYAKPKDAIIKDPSIGSNISEHSLNVNENTAVTPEMITLSEIGAARSKLAKKSLPHDYLVLEKEDKC